MDIQWFKDLERLRQTGNFSQAAEYSDLSQSAFSRRIQALESWVGVKLVDRSRQPVTLTDAGSRMLEAGLQAAARIETERSQILESLSLPDKYVVTFGTQHSIGWRFFPQWLKSLEDGYGPILSRLRADDLPNCLRALRRAEIDFAIAYRDAPCDGRPVKASHDFGGLECLPIGSDRLIPVCKPNADGTPAFPIDDQVLEIPYLRFGDAAPIGRHVEPMLDALGLSQRLQTVYENSMAGALRMRACDGHGVAWLPESLVVADIESGRLVFTGQPDWSVDLAIVLVRVPRDANRLTGSLWDYLADANRSDSKYDPPVRHPTARTARAAKQPGLA